VPSIASEVARRSASDELTDSQTAALLLSDSEPLAEASRKLGSPHNVSLYVKFRAYRPEDALLGRDVANRAELIERVEQARGEAAQAYQAADDEALRRS
jgi:hypothetical protein